VTLYGYFVLNNTTHNILKVDEGVRAIAIGLIVLICFPEANTQQGTGVQGKQEVNGENN
jgi:hypothetical protein